MTNYQVTCITKPNAHSSHEHITHIGSYGTIWTSEQAIRLIEAGTASFYVLVGGSRAQVEVVNSAIHGKYLRTNKDRTGKDNLLSLSQC